MDAISGKSAEIESVRQAELDLAAAHLTLDLETIARLLHPDYVIVQPGGMLEGREETLASLQGENRRWELAQCDEMDVRLYGETAIVIGRWSGRGWNEAERFDYQARFLSVWVREAGVWRNVAYQASEII